MTIKLLLRTPDPLPNEGISGFVLRVSEANGYETPWHILTHAGYEQGQMFNAAFSVDGLAGILGKPTTLLADHSNVGTTSEGLAEYRLNGHSIGRGLSHNPFRINRPAICPACIKQCGHSNACWDASAFVACPRHGQFLLNKCAACNSRLSWYRPGLLRCRCGASFADRPADPAPDSTIALMALMESKILGGSIADMRNDQNLPLDQLDRMPLESMLRLFSILERMNVPTGSSDDQRNVVSDAFAQWPTGFHAFLRRIGDDRSASAPQSTGLRKRFARFYQALFKLKVPLTGIDFVRDQFVQFGLEEWGQAVVDKKLLRSTPKGARFVSGNALASQVGVMNITVRRWIERGTMPATSIFTGTQNRYVIDTSKVDNSDRLNMDRLDERQAGKVANLPVSVLRELKRTGHYSPNPIANNRSGYWPIDLTQLNVRLVGMAPTTAQPGNPCPVAIDAVVSLDRILRYWKLGVKAAKGAFLADVLDGTIVPVAISGAEPRDLLFRVSDIEAFRLRYAIVSGRETISAKAVMKLLGTGEDAIAGLVADGYLLRDADCRTGIIRTSVDEFVRVWRPLGAIAKEIQTSPAALALKAQALGLSMLRLASHPRLRTPFVRTADVPILKESAKRLHFVSPNHPKCTDQIQGSAAASHQRIVSNSCS
jgi:hypothetical protein